MVHFRDLGKQRVEEGKCATCGIPLTDKAPSPFYCDADCQDIWMREEVRPK